MSRHEHCIAHLRHSGRSATQRALSRVIGASGKSPPSGLHIGHTPAPRRVVKQASRDDRRLVTAGTEGGAVTETDIKAIARRVLEEIFPADDDAALAELFG